MKGHFKQFKDNQMKVNSNICYLTLCQNDQMEIEVDNETKKSKKLLGIKIGSKLTFCIYAEDLW